MADPEEITIIVHSAKGLQGKKAGRHKYSVIFGLGGTKFRTTVVKEPTGNPDWNEETIVQVCNILDQVFFIVTEKDDILGQLSIPVTTLKGTKGQLRKTPLQPHKKCPRPQGEILYQCFVSKFRAPGDHLPVIKNPSQTPDNVRPTSAFQRLRKRMASPSTQRRFKQKEDKKDKSDGSLSLSFNKKLSRSIQDLFSFSKMSSGDSFDVDENDSVSSNKNNNSKLGKYKRKFSMGFISMNNNLDQAGKDPVITSCTPNMGPTDKPVRLTIEGRNLGIGKSDILALKVAGCDCTDTIEYESSTTIYCTTHFWKACKGPVIIDNISGGIGTLKDGYTFYEELDANQNSSTNPFDTDDSVEALDTLNDGDTSIPEFTLGGKEIKSGSNTLPRIRNSGTGNLGNRSPVTSTPNVQGRYKKHTRHASESATTVLSKQMPPLEHISKEELQQKIEMLELENGALKKDNVEMRSYIDKLVAKCMLHCPEALAQDDDEKSKLFVL